MNTRERLRREVLSLIERGVGRPAEPAASDALALRIFEHQYAENEPYRRYCDRRDATPDSVSELRDIPVVPTAAFKEAALICGPPEDAEAVFRTSGTTQGPERRGRHFVCDLSLYRASALENFRAHLLPEGSKLRALILGPPPRIAGDSSLTWMLERVRAELAAPASDYYVDESGLTSERLRRDLGEAASNGEPVLLLGTTAAFAHLVESLEERARAFELAPGTRIMETGGFKRRGREIPRDELYRRLTERLGVPESYIVNEYGMTEMCSQFYDNVLRDRARARPPVWRYKVVPPWVRTVVVDAETLEPAPPGRPGVLRHYDLANLDSVMAIQTDDLGVSGADGFEILGRAAGAEARGCSIAMDEWLSAQR